MARLARSLILITALLALSCTAVRVVTVPSPVHGVSESQLLNRAITCCREAGMKTHDEVKPEWLSRGYAQDIAADDSLLEILRSEDVAAFIYRKPDSLLITIQPNFSMGPTEQISTDVMACIEAQHPGSSITMNTRWVPDLR